MRNRLPKKRVLDLHTEYLASNISLKALGEKYGLTYRILVANFKAESLEVKASNSTSTITEARAVVLHQRYLSGESRIDLAKEAGVSESCLFRTFLRYHLSAKPDSDVKRDRVTAIKKSNFEKYGEEFYAQTEEARQNQSEKSKTLDWDLITQKRKDTNQKRYGVDNPSQRDDIKEKKQTTLMANYGVHAPIQAESIKNKIRNTKMKLRLEKLLPRLSELGYELLDEYIGNRVYDDDRNHVEWRKYNIRHSVCGHTFQDDLFELPRCRHCYPLHESLAQTHFLDYIKSLVPAEKVIKGDKSSIKNPRTGYPLELDILLPDRGIAFEYNGVYYHSLDVKEKEYHALKTSLCLEAGIRLYHIWEFDSIPIVESRIANILGLSTAVGARLFEFVEIDYLEARTFLDLNHLHGGCACSHAFGLRRKSDGRLQAVLTLRPSGSYLEIARFCTELNTSIQGGFKKILKHLPVDVDLITYADRDWTPDSTSSVYAKAGFDYLGDTGCSLRYANLSKGTIHSRVTFQKYKLEAMFPKTWDKDLTGREILRANNIVPIYNSGNHKFILRIKKGQA